MLSAHCGTQDLDHRYALTPLMARRGWGQGWGARGAKLGEPRPPVIDLEDEAPGPVLAVVALKCRRVCLLTSSSVFLVERPFGEFAAVEAVVRYAPRWVAITRDVHLNARVAGAGFGMV